MCYRSPLAAHYQPVETQRIGPAEVPWEFTLLEEEYRALREKAGLLDYSCLGRVEVSGEKALEFLQLVCPRDLEYLLPERSLTCLLLSGEARPVDVVTIFNQEDRYLVETSPAGREEVYRLLSSACPGEVAVRDLSDRYGVLGLEGPYAWRTLARVVDFEVSVLPFQGFLPATWEGEQLLVSRTGFTAEYGYKIYAAPEAAVKLWSLLKEEAPPVGYHALEVAMLEVRQPMIHRELGDDGTVIRCGFNWLVDLRKEGFWGREALLSQQEAGFDYLTIGFGAGKGIALAAGCPVAAAGEEIGRVVTFLFSPGLDQILGLARLQYEWVASGLELQVRDVNGRWHPARTLSAPYITPRSWNVTMV
ncbi:MAG: aminomethyl transferase family protein [Armatimonadetes bacterium]|nr:aminomethyl transferase family protein [Armatimonadota bacterium]